MVKPTRWVAGTAGLVAVGLLVFAVAASAAPRHVSAVRGRVSMVRAGNGPSVTAEPTSKIALKKGVAVFKPNTLTAPGRWKGKRCTKAQSSFFLKNVTPSAQEIFLNGTDAGSLPSGGKAFVCAIPALGAVVVAAGTSPNTLTATIT